MRGGRGEDTVPRVQKKEQPTSGKLMGCVGPGSYLLSRDLSSDYHRRANVSLPGSGWDRVGPLGCDHQASACSAACRLLAHILQAACLRVSELVVWLLIHAGFKHAG